MTDKLKKVDEQQEILDNILRELEIAKDQSKAIAEKLSDQTKKMDNTTKSINSVDHDMDVSGWHLDYLKSTFGKVYKKFNKFPLKDKAKSTIKRLTLKSKLTRLQVDEIESNSTRQSNDKYDEISKTWAKTPTSLELPSSAFSHRAQWCEEQQLNDQPTWWQQ